VKRRLDRAFHPPAAVVPITIRAPGGVDEIRLDGKIDTGADICCLPQHSVVSLDLPPTRTLRATGFAGAPTEVIVYRVDIEIDGVTHPRVEAIATTRPYAIVGRNVLRSLILRVDGPGEVLDLSFPKRKRRRR
jgi:predicted aspartyl protease